MDDSQFYTIHEKYGLKHYQVPKVFFTSPLYKNMSTDAKLAWAILRDRFTLSEKNKWYDEDGKIFFILTNDELMTLLDCAKEKLTKIKKELVNASLLYQKRQGVNKPNKLYLLKPIINDVDIYLIDDLENIGNKEDYIYSPKSGSSKIELPEKDAETLGNKGSSKIELLEVRKSNPIYTDSNDLDIKDNKDTRDTKFNQKREDLLKDSLKDYLPPQTFNNFKALSNNFDDMQKFTALLFKAKALVERRTGDLLLIEEEPELDFQLANAFLKGIRRIEHDGDIKSKDNYLFITFKNTFESYLSLLKRKKAQDNNGFPNLFK